MRYWRPLGRGLQTRGTWQGLRKQQLGSPFSLDKSSRCISETQDLCIGQGVNNFRDPPSPFLSRAPRGLCAAASTKDTVSLRRSRQTGGQAGSPDKPLSTSRDWMFRPQQLWG